MKHLTFLLAAIALFFLSTCEKEPANPPAESPPAIGPEFQKYVERFVEEYQKRVPDARFNPEEYTIRFANPGEFEAGVRGRCIPGHNKEIIIAEEHWNDFDTVLQELLMFHELGHCALDRRFHDRGTLRFGALTCKSIMSPSIYGTDCGIDYYAPMWREFYLDELFGLKEEPDWLEVGSNYHIEDLQKDTFYVSEFHSSLIEEAPAGQCQVELFFDRMSSVVFQMGDYQVDFSYQGFGQVNGESIVSYQGQPIIRYPFWNGVNWSEDQPMKFTFRFLDGVLYFYFNELLVFNREAVPSGEQIIDIGDTEGVFSKVMAVQFY